MRSIFIPTDAIVVFLMVATALGVLFEFVGLPALAGEIFAGFLLGPPLADYVPFPEAMVLVGKLPHKIHAYTSECMEDKECNDIDCLCCV